MPKTTKKTKSTKVTKAKVKSKRKTQSKRKTAKKKEAAASKNKKTTGTTTRSSTKSKTSQKKKESPKSIERKLSLMIKKTKSKTKKKVPSPKTIETRLKNLVKKAKKTKVSKSKDKPLELDLKKEKTNKVVLFDTNFLMIPGEFKIDIFMQSKKLLSARKVDFIIFDKTIFELQKLANGSSKHAKNAKVALELINDKNVSILSSKTDDYVDDLIVNYNDYFPNFKGEIIIATQDKELKGRLKKKAKLLVMKNKSTLALS